VAVNFEYAPGATPLDPDEAAGLVPKHITHQGDLNAWEQANIFQADRWAARQTKRDLLDEGFVRDLHRQMFDKTWLWAGTFRKSNKNIGVDKLQIPVAIKSLLDDALYWVKHQTMSPEAIAIHFKHRLVSIHCFANGNGRHSRLMADLIISKLYNQPEFTWGSVSSMEATLQRNQYLSALREADKGDISLLLNFAKS
jgi:Fic-DOC domain mobile mystery protein B